MLFGGHSFPLHIIPAKCCQLLMCITHFKHINPLSSNLVCLYFKCSSLFVDWLLFEMTTKEKVVEYIWQDRELRFDSKPILLACRRGEKVIDSINSVEDTKGNNGERGSLIVTNLRILWIAHANSKINLSIGLNSIISVNIRKAKSKLRGRTQALCVLAKFTSRFEFIFTSLVKNSPRLFTTVQAVMR